MTGTSQSRKKTGGKSRLGTALALTAIFTAAATLTYGRLTTNSDFVPFTGELRQDVRHYRSMLEDPKNRALYDTLVAENKCYILKRPHQEACEYYQKRGMNWPNSPKAG